MPAFIPNTIDSILLDVIVEPDPEDLSGRHPSCPPTGCWEHRLKPGPQGYRLVRLQQKPHRLHRLVYETLCGPIPGGLQLDHLCRNRGCCNPWHLEPVPSRVNTLRGETLQAKNAAKTHCLRGHALAGENLIVRPDGTRNCRECRRERARQSHQRNLDVRRERSRLYKERNREALREYARRYRSEHLEACRERNRECERRRYARKKALLGAQSACLVEAVTLLGAARQLSLQFDDVASG